MGDTPVFTLEPVNNNSWTVEPYIPDSTEKATIAYYYPEGVYHNQEQPAPAPVAVAPVAIAPAPVAVTPAQTTVHINPAPQMPPEKAVVVEQSHKTHGCVKASIAILFLGVLAVGIWLFLLKYNIV